MSEQDIIQINAPAPAFSLPTNSGEVSLAGYAGKRVVLYFYPKDNTSGCTSQAVAFANNIDAFDAANTVILGVSKDSLKSHANFKEKYNLPFELGADEDGKVCEAYDVWKEKSMYGRKYMGIERSTFLIDEQGVIRAVWRKVKVTKHAEAVLKAIAAL